MHDCRLLLFHQKEIALLAGSKMKWAQSYITVRIKFFVRYTKIMSSNNTPKNSNLNNQTKVYNGSGKNVSHFFPCEIKTLFKIALKIQFFTRAEKAHLTLLKPKKQVQKQSRWVEFHGSALSCWQNLDIRITASPLPTPAKEGQFL